MSLIRGLAGQKWRVFAFSLTTNAPVLGNAGNITAKISLNHAPLQNLLDVNPTEVEDGFYLFDLDADTETQGNVADLYPESSTPNVQVIGVPGTYDIDEPVPETPPPDAPTLAELMVSPKRTRTAEGTVEERTVDELIKADRYNNPGPDAVPWGIRIARTKPPSTCS
jgi:hypothetical protein